MTASHTTTARAIRIGERFFCKFDRAGNVRTAWCIAGAQLFQSGTDHELAPVLRRLDAAGKAHRVVTVKADES